MTTTRRQFTREFKLDAVRRVTGGGQSQAQVGRDLKVAAKLVGRWVRQSQEKGDQAFLSDGRFKPGDNRVGQLMRENRRLREERDVLKRALAICSERRL